MSFASLPLVVALAAVCTLSGRLVAGAIGLAPLRRFGPAAGAASAILGTAFVTLAFGWLSSIGLQARPAAFGVLLLHLPLAAACVRRGRPSTLLGPHGRLRGFVPLLAAAAVAATAALLPVLRTGGFMSGNDTYTYAAFAEWLQRHAFAEMAVADPRVPVTQIPALFQGQGYTLGIAYFLALVQAATRAPSALLVYPSVSAWGVVLCAMATYVAARWTLRLGERWSGAAALAFAILPHPLYLGHHNGFLQQSYALPVLLFSAALLSRIGASRRPGTPAGAALGLLAAFLLTVYVPVLPLAGAAAGGALALATCRPRRPARAVAWRPLAVSAVTLAFVTAIAGFSSLRGLGERFGRFVESKPGEHVRLSAVEMVQLAMGTRIIGPHQVPLSTWLSPAWQALTPLFVFAALLGFVVMARRRRSWPLAAMAGLLVAAVAYYALVARDPWTGERGHTWNVLKLAQWGFPLVLLAQASAARLVSMRASRAVRAVGLPLCALGLASSVGLHAAWSVPVGSTMREVLLGPRPLDHLAELKGKIRDLPEGTLVVLARPANRHRWLAAHVALLTYSRPVVGDWTDSATISATDETGAAYDAALAHLGRPGVLPLLCAFRPFQPGGYESIGYGLAVLDPSVGPLVLYVVNPAGLKGDTDAPPAFAMGRGRTKVILWSPRQTRAKLRLELAPYPPARAERPALDVFVSNQDYTKRAVRTVVEEGRAARILLDGARVIETPPFDLTPGLSTVVLLLVPAQPLSVERLRAEAVGP